MNLGARTLRLLLNRHPGTEPHPMIRIGLDPGGTKIEIIALDLVGRERVRERVDTPRGEYRVARSLAMVVNLIDPDVIVLGGALSNCASLYGNAPRFWLDFVFSDRVDTRLAPPKFGDSSGIRGAAWVWGNVAPNFEHNKSE